LIVLMTDGLANWHNGRYDPTGAKQSVLDEAAAAAALKYKVMTIGLGVDADTTSMQQVADITDGVFYYVPGGSNYSTMHTQLRQAFKEIADARPMLIVK
jgi:hypothetical protein